ncbi:hypothetical protein [Tomitella fengzijianii]|uniref:Uncharacterized protein n=1 Tax=Tomitella fengzijianii TaxID=2597660 RepID=A0A516WYU8_9ACTN|nr:hypothetical protein [Tomitella fengzijianii]QDQ96019.1 hypothetical protein FO059_00030 [Tomitella fengzijianii]
MPHKIRRIAGSGAALVAAVALAIPAAGAAAAIDLPALGGGSLGSLDVLGSLGGSAYEGVAGTVTTEVSEDGATNKITLTQSGGEAVNDVLCRAYVVPNDALEGVDDHEMKLMISQGMGYDGENDVDENDVLQLDTNAGADTDSSVLNAADLTAGDYSIVSACFNYEDGLLGAQQSFTVVDNDGTLTFAQAGGGLLGSLDLFGSLGALSAS